MNTPTVVDTLIVYTDGIAVSASSKNPSHTHPFPLDSKFSSYNECYAYFLTACRKKGLKIAFTTSGDLSADGTFKSYWMVKGQKWQKINKSIYAPLIFEKFSPINESQKEKHATLFANLNITPFNTKIISELFSDKQKTYSTLSKFTIPTVILKDSSVASIEKAYEKLKALVDLHPESGDFSGKVIVKDRFGAGGNNIFRSEEIEKKAYIRNIMSNNADISFVMQPFANFDQGYLIDEKSGFVDVRIIYVGRKVVQAYIRTAAKNDFRCNVHQGGGIEYVKIGSLPEKIKFMANEIIETLGDESSFFALDFIMSNKGNAYLMEGNSHPGIIWGLKDKNDEFHTKKLIRKIVKELALRVKNHSKMNLSVAYDRILPVTNIPVVI